MGKVSANLLSLEAIEPDCSKRFAHSNSANVAVMKLNGAQDINQVVFWADFAPDWGDQIEVMHQQLYRLREQARSHT
jgi:hypothetical protein